MVPRRTIFVSIPLSFALAVISSGIGIVCASLLPPFVTSALMQISNDDCEAMASYARQSLSDVISLMDLMHALASRYCYRSSSSLRSQRSRTEAMNAPRIPRQHPAFVRARGWPCWRSRPP